MGLFAFNRMRREAAEAAEAAELETAEQEEQKPLKLSEEDYNEMTRNKANVMAALVLYGQDFDEKNGATELREQLNEFILEKGLMPDAN